MKPFELISVIMSTYNETEKELKQSIESILNQTWKNLEFIIINDNPQNTLLQEVLDKYARKDNRIKIFRNEKNTGLAGSLNYALKQAEGEYIARMDADDISLPERLEREMNYLEKCSLDMVASNRISISEEGEKLERFGRLPAGRKVEKLLPYGNPVVHPSVLVKKKVLIQLKGYRELVPVEDYDLWLRMLTAGYRLGLLDEELIYYRVREKGISQANHYKRYLLEKYVRYLYWERKKCNRADSFSEENVKREIEKNYTYKKEMSFNKAHKIFIDAVSNIKKGKKCTGIYCLIKAVLRDHNCANDIFHFLNYERRKRKILGE